MARPVSPTYFLAPKWTFPVDGPIQLGNIITNPCYPHSYLVRIDPDDEGFPATYSHIGGEWDREIYALVDAQLKLKASVAGVADSVLRAGRNVTKIVTLHGESMETISLAADPQTKDVARWLQDENVAPKINRLMNTVLYMVSGIKIATNFRVEIKLEKEAVAETGANLPIAAVAGADVRANAQAGRRMIDSGTSAGSGGVKIVIAYQLLEIKINKWRGTLSTDEYHSKEAFLSNNETGTRIEPGELVTPDRLSVGHVSTGDEGSLQKVAESFRGLNYVIDGDQWDWLSQYEAS